MESLVSGGPLIWGHAVLLVGGLLWAAVCAVLLGMRWKVPPIVATAPLLMQGLYILSAAVWATRESALGGADPAQAATLAAAALAQVFAQGTAAIAALPVAVVLLLGGLAAGVRGRRGWGAPVFVLVVAGLVALLPAADLARYVDPVWVAVRVLVYGLAALPVAAALVGAHPQDNSREGSLVATVSYATLVASVELMVAVIGQNKIVAALVNVDPKSRPELLAAALEEFGATGTVSWVVVALAAATGVVALLRPAAELTDEEVLAGNVSPSGARWFGGALALLVPLAWAAARLACDPSPLLAAWAS